MSSTAWLFLLILALCVGFSAFFSAAETAFMAASRVRLKTRQQDGKRSAGLALKLAEDSDRLLSTILVGNNIVNIAGTAIATVLFTMWVGDYGATLSTVVMTLLILTLGEVTPKTLARRTPEDTAMALAPALNVLMKLLSPLSRLFTLWQRLILRLTPARTEEPDIEAEIITMVDEAQKEGDLDAHERELIRSAIEFVDQDVRDIMTPRVDVTALPEEATMAQAADAFRESGYSRIPVYREDMDHIVGVLNEKDFYSALHNGEREIRHIMAAPVYTHESLKISKLLKLCQSTRTHLIIVLDEFGGMSGIVTLEDALEELVGEIWDEHDDVSEEMAAVDENTWQVDGRMQLTEMLERLGIEDTYEADTVGGWVSEVLGRIPNVGLSFDEAGLHCTVTGMDRRRVTRVRVSRIRPPEAAKQEET